MSRAREAGGPEWLRRQDVYLALALLGAGWIVRLAVASRLVFPPLDDPAFYVQTARNLAVGRGLVSDVLWSYQFPFDSVTHPSHEYWMPLATLLMAPWIRVFGDTLLNAQLPGTLCGALLPPLTYLLGRLVAVEDRRVAVGASVMALAGALPVYQSGSTDSAAPFALLGAGALLAGGWGVERGSKLACLVAGLLSGLAYLTRSDGLLLPLLLGAYLVASLRFSRRAFVLLGLLALGAALPMGAWWIRNLRAFGTPQPISALTAAALQDYPQLFNWQDPPTLRGLLDRGLGFVVDLRLRALGHNLGVWVLTAFPYGAFGWAGLIRTRRALLGLGLAYIVALYLASALVFSVPTVAGLFYHSVGAALPWLAVGAARVLVWLGARQKLAAFGLGLATAVLLIAQSALAWPRAIDDAAENAREFQMAAAWLEANVDPGEPVIATQAHTLNYVSGYPAMSLPTGQAIEAVYAVARHYGAQYVLITEQAGRYPEALDAALGKGVVLVEPGPDLLIYRLTLDP